MFLQSARHEARRIIDAFGVAGSTPAFHSHLVGAKNERYDPDVRETGEESMLLERDVNVYCR